ncbi:methionine aminopeptidase, type I [Pneumocystis carinii B80]|uniref:Methionine aminopeptidase n=1 Tax=Pneumocystis carinii (strain B80) TaxID=1408658 RepID=A0A0W4ZGA8_PNEC8|nr:methionine aminopeptidase, type I [Pneumocystis carinii B80]KTW27419.1 methionine aminopeptidase, type I [Pneumocystis carinii B80]
MSICKGVDCNQVALSLQCPVCLKLGIQGSFFCSQDCFKKNWSFHKEIHSSGNCVFNSSSNLTYDPFPNFAYTGTLRACYPLSPRRKVPLNIKLPDYAEDGIPRSEQAQSRSFKAMILTKEEQQGMRKVCKLAREVLDIAAAALRPGITTDEIDEIVHMACIERDSYPSPLNYYNFPKSVCTSVNETICHGIPDKYVLKDGDIVNLDVTLYHGGFHGDLNETYYVGEKAKQDADSVRVVETARECLERAIKIVKPGTLFRDIGSVIEGYAKSRNCSTVRTYCGHGINKLFHCFPEIPHYAKNKAVGIAKPGMCFTIEPMISLGSHEYFKNLVFTLVGLIIGHLQLVMGNEARNSHTLLVTENGVEVLTARNENSPGGPIPLLDAK